LLAATFFAGFSCSVIQPHNVVGSWSTRLMPPTLGGAGAGRIGSIVARCWVAVRRLPSSIYMWSALPSPPAHRLLRHPSPQPARLEQHPELREAQ